MRFTSIFLTGALAAFASAQSATTGEAAQSSQQAAITRCLKACQDGDVSCNAKCIAVPNPNEDQVNETNKCVAGCDQGDGSASDTAAYGVCVNDCIGRHYFTATGTPAQATGGAGTGSGGGGSSNNNDDDTVGGDDSGNNDDSSPSASGNQNQASGNPSASSPAASASGNAAPGSGVQVAGMGAGLVGLVLGVLAL